MLSQANENNGFSWRHAMNCGSNYKRPCAVIIFRQNKLNAPEGNFFCSTADQILEDLSNLAAP
jgi:hypothetical protein